MIPVLPVNRILLEVLAGAPLSFLLKENRVINQEVPRPGPDSGQTVSEKRRSTMTQYRVIARAKDSRCPHVKEGDQMVIEGTMVNLKETDSLCAVALGAIQYSLFMMGKAKDPKDFGRPEVYTLQCPDPETRVLFEISREVIEK
jgi:uncharacterized repeat protein (TIGR04076 family)